jgi:hypothetical protein
MKLSVSIPEVSEKGDIRSRLRKKYALARDKSNIEEQVAILKMLSFLAPAHNKGILLEWDSKKWMMMKTIYVGKVFSYRIKR